MVDNNVGSMLVTRKGKIVGILTERDYLRKIVHCGRSSTTTKVSEVWFVKIIYKEKQNQI